MVVHMDLIGCQITPFRVEVLHDLSISDFSSGLRFSFNHKLSKPANDSYQISLFIVRSDTACFCPFLYVSLPAWRSKPGGNEHLVSMDAARLRMVCQRCRLVARDVVSAYSSHSSDRWCKPGSILVIIYWNHM